MDELESVNHRIAELQAELSKLEERRDRLLSTSIRIEQAAFTPGQKIELFQSYFRGNPHCYANRWQNASGRNGYSIACANEWRNGVCDKPKVKCLECMHQAFKPLDRDAIYRHLTGTEIIGLYPMLSDSTCFVLAIDFDKSDWYQASQAYVEACEFYQVDCLWERSRSGKGAHVWVFFESAVTAKDARELGFLLLDKAMQIHSALSFDSYDRLFPNQDTLPVGGIGNLIALPLQKKARVNQNSVFLEHRSGQPYQDQWLALQSIKKVSISKLGCLISNMDRDAGHLDARDLKPWERNVPTTRITENCPSVITIVLANRIYLPLSELPNPLVARLKKLASFSNPKFFKAQGMRLSTNGIARFICLAELDNGYLSLPRGCLDDVQEILAELHIKVELVDKRVHGQKLQLVNFQGELRKSQQKAVDALLNFDSGVLHAPTAFGKTVTAIGLIAQRKINTLILVHSKQLADQWRERLTAFADGIDIGLYTGAKKKPTTQVDIATYQSLISRSDNTVNPIIQEYGQIIVDECHHLSAPQYERVLSEAHAKYVYGVSATLERRDGHQPIIFMQLGKVRHTIKVDKASQFQQILNCRALAYAPPLTLTNDESKPHISEVYRWLMEHPERNKQILSDALSEIHRGRVPIILTERREHASALYDALIKDGVSAQLLVGSMKKKSLKQAMEQLDSAQALVATGKFVGEGFDLPRLDTLVLALPVSWKGSLIQYVGRIQRQYKGKTEVKVIDYVDTKLPMLQRMYKRREKGYKALGFEEEVQERGYQSSLDLPVDIASE
jgi:superfamily II DNA or RNA helicase